MKGHQTSVQRQAAVIQAMRLHKSVYILALQKLYIVQAVQDRQQPAVCVMVQRCAWQLDDEQKGEDTKGLW